MLPGFFADPEFRARDVVSAQVPFSNASGMKALN
jgi:hypothetical protein